MTVAICYHSPEGIVFGTDTALEEWDIKSDGTILGGKFTYNRKIHKFDIPEEIGCVAYSTYGIDGFPNRSVGSLSHLTADFSLKLVETPPTSMLDVARRWSDFTRQRFRNSFGHFEVETHELLRTEHRTNAQNAKLENLLRYGCSFQLGGYVGSETRTSAFKIEHSFNPLRNTSDPTPIRVGVMERGGEVEIIERITTGCDPIGATRILNSPLWIPGNQDPKTREGNLWAVFFDLLHRPKADLGVQEAFELVYDMINITIKAKKHSGKRLSCNKPIEIAAISRTKQFEWLFVGEREGHPGIGSIP